MNFSRFSSNEWIFSIGFIQWMRKERESGVWYKIGIKKSAREWKARLCQDEVSKCPFRHAQDFPLRNSNALVSRARVFSLKIAIGCRVYELLAYFSTQNTQNIRESRNLLLISTNDGTVVFFIFSPPYSSGCQALTAKSRVKFGESNEQNENLKRVIRIEISTTTPRRCSSLYRPLQHANAAHSISRCEKRKTIVSAIITWEGGKKSNDTVKSPQSRRESHSEFFQCSLELCDPSSWLYNKAHTRSEESVYREYERFTW